MSLPLHFIHANGFNGDCYNALFSHFDPKYTVFKQPMLGHHPQFPVARNWRYQVDEVKQAIGQHSQDRLILVGHSLGGILAFMTACKVPQRVAGVIMIDPPILTGSSRWLFRFIKKTPLVDKFTPAGLTKTRRQHWPLETNMTDYFATKSLFKNFTAESINDYARHGVKRGRNGWELVFNPDVETRFFRHVPDNLNTFKGQLQCPALLISAKHTTVCTKSRRNRFMSYNAMEHIELDGGHMLPMEKPKEVAQQIMAAITRWGLN